MNGSQYLGFFVSKPLKTITCTHTCHTYMGLQQMRCMLLRTFAEVMVAPMVIGSALRCCRVPSSSIL